MKDVCGICGTNTNDSEDAGFGRCANNHDFWVSISDFKNESLTFFVNEAITHLKVDKEVLRSAIVHELSIKEELRLSEILETIRVTTEEIGKTTVEGELVALQSKLDDANELLNTCAYKRKVFGVHSKERTTQFLEYMEECGFYTYDTSYVNDTVDTVCVSTPNGKCLDVSIPNTHKITNLTKEECSVYAVRFYNSFLDGIDHSYPVIMLESKSHVLDFILKFGL